MKGNLGESWGKLLESQFCFYMGQRASKENNQWIWRDKSFSTIEEFRSAVDEYIKEGGRIIQNSIKK